MLPDVDGLSGALDAASRLRAALAQAFFVEDVELDVDASIGVVISGAHGNDAQTLLQRADIAINMALALAQAKVWADKAHHIPVAVNISARNLPDDTFADRVKGLLVEHAVDSGLLGAEVTDQKQTIANAPLPQADLVERGTGC